MCCGQGRAALAAAAAPAANLYVPPAPPAPVPAAGPNDRTAIRDVSAKDGEAHGDVMDSIRRRVSEYDRLLGETLDGRYLVQRKIGEGGMGVVFAVKHTVIERPLAIKVLKRDVMRDEATRKRFIQEARAASRIGDQAIEPLLKKTFDRAVLRVPEACAGTDEGVRKPKEALRTLHDIALSQPVVDKAAWIAAALGRG